MYIKRILKGLCLFLTVFSFAVNSISASLIKHLAPPSEKEVSIMGSDEDFRINPYYYKLRQAGITKAREEGYSESADIVNELLDAGRYAYAVDVIWPQYGQLEKAKVSEYHELMEKLREKIATISTESIMGFALALYSKSHDRWSRGKFLKRDYDFHSFPNEIGTLIEDIIKLLVEREELIKASIITDHYAREFIDYERVIKFTAGIINLLLAEVDDGNKPQHNLILVNRAVEMTKNLARYEVGYKIDQGRAFDAIKNICENLASKEYYDEILEIIIHCQSLKSPWGENNAALLASHLVNYVHDIAGSRESNAFAIACMGVKAKVPFKVDGARRIVTTMADARRVFSSCL